MTSPSSSESTDSGNEFQDGPPSGSSSSALSQPWWRNPERIASVAGAVGLRFAGKLSEELLVLVLLAALGTPLAKWMLGLVRKKQRLTGGK